MMFDLKGKVAVITGGAKGIGAAAVKNFLDEGAKFVAFVDVDEISGTLLEKDLQVQYGKGSVKYFKGDVTKDEELFDVFNFTVKHHGGLDVVMNNAGIGNDAIHKMEIDINFKAVVTSSLKALEMMRKDHGGIGGTILNISSIAALSLYTEPIISVYCATKSAVLMFGANLGNEGYYLHTGVRVVTVCMGLTSTDLVSNLRGIDDVCTTATSEYVKGQYLQPVSVAATGIVEAFKNGTSGSIWLISDSQITDITERVKKAYKVMSGEIEI